MKKLFRPLSLIKKNASAKLLGGGRVVMLMTNVVDVDRAPAAKLKSSNGVAERV